MKVRIYGNISLACAKEKPRKHTKEERGRLSSTWQQKKLPYVYVK